jgi:hypothetical protein
MGHQLSPQQFSVFLTSKLAEVSIPTLLSFICETVSASISFQSIVSMFTPGLTTAGAIMFGDPLLPSECCLIIEELKTTSLCFQVRKHNDDQFPIFL